ncbi:MAG: coniferyl aldehyde dehydrogenase [Sandaracinaceae bacterium]
MPATTPAAQSEPTTADPLREPLATLKRGFDRDRNPSLKARIGRLDALERLVMDNRDTIIDTVSQDFGNRSAHETLIAEIFMVVEGIRHAKSHLRGWMKPVKRKVGIASQPAKAKLHYQPKGVVGIISPWNYPVNLALAPMAGALAAGNRVMLKPSELTPKTSALLKRLTSEYFAPDLVQTVTGGVQVGIDFSHLAFDHLVFTGSTTVGRLVMKAAAENLVPVTLELGGKSPTLVHESYPVEKAAEAITFGKWFNSGQTCIAPDYLLVPEAMVEPLVAAIEARVRVSYPTLADNPDYTAVINEDHRARLVRTLEDARDRGARVIEINPAREDLAPSGKLAPTLVLDVDDSMKVMQDEIFGPILPVVPYRRLDEALRYVNDRDRPLALYYFDDDASRVAEVLEKTVAGGVAVNACLMHFGQDDLPFGGVGPSGIGAYHGFEGFQAFSHAKSVFYQSKLNAASLLAPPHGKTLEVLLRVLLRG